MKKFFLLSLTVLVLTACSTDDSSFEQQQNSVTTLMIETGTTNYSNARGVSNLLPSNQSKCVRSLSAHVSADASGGLNDITLLFTLDQALFVTNSQYYKVILELQPISDCEDLDTAIGAPVIYQSVSPSYNQLGYALIEIEPSQLPSSCYKWRMIIERYSENSNEPQCSSATEWYFDPVF